MPKLHPFQQAYIKPEESSSTNTGKYQQLRNHGNIDEGLDSGESHTMFEMHSVPSESAMDLILKRRNIFMESHIEANQWGIDPIVTNAVTDAGALITTHDLVASPIKERKQTQREMHAPTSNRAMTLRNTEAADISFLYTPTAGKWPHTLHTY